MNYELNDNNEIFVFIPDQTDPLLFQPSFPDGTEWTAEEAEAWAEMFIAHFQDPEQPEPPLGRNIG